MNPAGDPTAEAVLRYWFGEALDDAETAKEKQRLWWGKDAAVDEDIRQRFGELPDRALRGELDAWTATARGSLALIVLMDQFPRNMYRGTPRSFAYDPQAKAHAGRAVAQGLDRQLRPVERVFLYLPFEHSEAIADQDRSVTLFTALSASVPDAQRKAFEGYVDYALKHREVIARFGRFPHRNAILGRASTAEELVFLSQPGSSF